MRLHRNSQKRVYVPNGIYFITTNTYHRYPYFDNDILCELFIETLDFTSLIKEFNLHGVAINLEHLHLMIEPTGKYNFSEIMGTLKRNFSRDCNDLMSGRCFQRDGAVGNESGKSGDGARGISRKYMDIRGNQFFQAHLLKLSEWQKEYFANGAPGPKVPFKWQSSFRHHVIQDENDYLNHLNYIMKQPLKHNLPGRIRLQRSRRYWITGDSADETDDTSETISK